jgi:hypothetical protein
MEGRFRGLGGQDESVENLRRNMVYTVNSEMIKMLYFADGTKTLLPVPPRQLGNKGYTSN